MDNQKSSFEYTALESDMRRLAAEIESHRDRLEMKDASEKELLKEAIRAFPRPEHNIVSASASQSQAQTNAQSPLPNYAENAAPEVKLEIEYLIDLVFHHGLEKALSEGDKSPAFVRDVFHDALAGKLYPELQRRGIIK